MQARLYYTAPSDEAFEDMKSAAMVVWERYRDQSGYFLEKTNKLKDIQNIKDNFMYIFAMFDHLNQRTCAGLLKKETILELRARLIDGENSESHINLILGSE